MVTNAEVVRNPRTASRVLTDARALVGPPLRRAVDSLPGPVRRAAGYHFGWLDDQGQPVNAGAGKMLRPALALLSAEAVGGSAENAVAVATAVELVHNFSLLHDDVMDGDRVRHHRPTVWSAFGIPTAVLAGDALWVLALQVLADTGAISSQASHLLTEALQGLVDGQSADLDFEHRDDVGLPECEAMALGKTGMLMGAACALGALSGGGSRPQVDALREFGERLGVAFQLVDDLLGLWGDPAVTGKPVGWDAVRRKKSLPVAAALASGTAYGAELAGLYRLDRPLTHAELARATSLVELAGGRDWARREADRRVREALAILWETTPVLSVRAELTALADLLGHRDC
jgi:geranylgeranyl diphosphate synthase type I